MQYSELMFEISSWAPYASILGPSYADTNCDDRDCFLVGNLCTGFVGIQCLVIWVLYVTTKVIR
jgi:hypothetical protein